MQSHHTKLEINSQKILVVFIWMCQNKGKYRDLWYKQLCRDWGLLSTLVMKLHTILEKNMTFYTQIKPKHQWSLLNTLITILYNNRQSWFQNRMNISRRGFCCCFWLCLNPQWTNVTYLTLDSILEHHKRVWTSQYNLHMHLHWSKTLSMWTTQ